MDSYGRVIKLVHMVSNTRASSVADCEYPLNFAYLKNKWRKVAVRLEASGRSDCEYPLDLL